MTRPSLRAWAVSIALAAPSLVAGCGTSPGGSEAGVPPVGGLPGPPPGEPGPGGGQGPNSPIGKIMAALGRGPNALTPTLEKELKENRPPWETIRGQAHQYVTLASELGRYDPPKGPKESWDRLTAAFAETAGDLDKAARAEDRDAALAAHGALANSCMACHREHRRMGPGRGGPPPGGFPGGPPPGYPGGPPPGGPEGGPPPPPPGGPPQ